MPVEVHSKAGAKLRCLNKRLGNLMLLAMTMPKPTMSEENFGV
jgi:hypothetical protein